MPVVFIHAGGDHGDASSRKLGAAGDAGDAAKTRSARRIIGTTWRAVRPAVNSATRDAVRFVPTASAAAETAALQEEVDRALLPLRYGGDADEARVPCPNLPGEEDVEET